MYDTIGMRIGALIAALGIRKVRFAERIKVDQAYVTQLTNGKRNPSDRLIDTICREFNVREAWLRTGQGDMFQPKARSDEIDAFMKEILRDDSDFRQKFISVLARMTADEWKLLERKVLELATEVTGGENTTPPQTDTDIDIEQEADAAAAEVREQVVLEKKVGVESSALLSDTGDTAGEKMA